MATMIILGFLIAMFAFGMLGVLIAVGASILAHRLDDGDDRAEFCKECGEYLLDDGTCPQQP